MRLIQLLLKPSYLEQKSFDFIAMLNYQLVNVVWGPCGEELRGGNR